MKVRSLLALVGLAIGFVVPTLAQQKDTDDPQIVEQLNALRDKSNEAFENGDAAALAALFTDDAVEVRTKVRFTVGRPLRNIIRTCSEKSISATVSASAIRIPLTF
jgi:hypothetical protein